MSAIVSTDQGSAARQGGTLLLLKGDGSFENANVNDFKAKKIALFIHGFTANAAHMKPLMQWFANNEYTALAFNYPCYRGIDSAAQTLSGLVSAFLKAAGAVDPEKKLVVIGHSMGGLVARAFVTLHGGESYVRKVLTLGTPHNGTLVGERAIGWLVSAGEAISGLIPGGYSPSSLSARELTKDDNRSGTPLLDLLRSKGLPSSVQFYTVSGGNPWLELGKNWLLNAAFNKVVQNHFRGRTNDGLVEESSSDLGSLFVPNPPKDCSHLNDYAEFGDTNHTYLCQNQTVCLKLLGCCDA